MADEMVDIADNRAEREGSNGETIRVFDPENFRRIEAGGRSRINIVRFRRENSLNRCRGKELT
jgi:hypothetical protein